MSTTSGVSNNTGTSNATNTAEIVTGMTQEDFLKVIVAEMTNQNPLSESGQNQSSTLLQNFMQLQQIQAMSDMSGSVETQTDQQKSMYASSLIGSYVDVVSEDGKTEKTGFVDSSRIVDGDVMIKVDGTEFKASNIKNIIDPYSLSTNTGDTTTTTE